MSGGAAATSKTGREREGERWGTVLAWRSRLGKVALGERATNNK